MTMQTVNVAWFGCRPAQAFQLASRVDRWPGLLSHYRWVRFHQGDPADGVVEMAARREFGRLQVPVWWVSRMTADRDALTVRYTHVDGVTRGMEVLWTIAPSYHGSRVEIRHDWTGSPRICGPAGSLVARRVVGPVFIHHVADQTLHHLARAAVIKEGTA
ncbi:MAG TPA: SRPBCC family protein [Symbiobacteriaceae bacterium]|nr:SRPBCC family protein [Symbiobacteriaceae bacterium]